MESKHVRETVTIMRPNLRTYKNCSYFRRRGGAGTLIIMM